MNDRTSIYEEMDEHLLFLCISKGDENAFAYVYSKYAPVLLVFCKKYIDNNEDAEDIVQQIFLKLWEKRKEINIKISIKDYLYKAVKHSVLNNIRNLTASILKHKEILERQNLLQESIEEVYMANESKTHLLLAIETLSPIKKQIILLRRDGYTSKEISKKLCIPENTVKTYYAQSLKFFREYFKKFVLILISFFINQVS